MAIGWMESQEVEAFRRNMEDGRRRERSGRGGAIPCYGAAFGIALSARSAYGSRWERRIGAANAAMRKASS